MLPLFLNLAERLAVVIGGGSVGRRKARLLLESGARVRLVCPDSPPLEGLAPAVEWCNCAYRAEHLDGARLVFAAATEEVNRQVVADARARGLWVNSASDPQSGDFYVPAVVRQGDFVLAVGTSGAAPGLAAAVRRQLESQFDATFGQWVALLAEVRPLVLATLADPDRRRDLFDHLCHWDWLARLRREGVESVRAAILAAVRGAAEHGENPL
jgi:precorrin-2 dehydrogenase/sirohydrochlorin ferrochelatase